MAPFSFFSLGKQGGVVALRAALLIASYLAAGRVGLLLAPEELMISLIWLPAGIATAALYRWGYRYTPFVFIAAALLQEFSFRVKWPLAGIIVTGQTLGPLAAAWLLRLNGFHASFDRRRDIFIFCFFSAVGLLIPCTTGTTLLCLIGEAPWDGYGLAWLHWWLGDWMGVLTVGPLLISISAASWKEIAERRLECVAWLGLSVFLIGMIFFFPGRPGITMLPLIFVPLVLTVWAAMRLGITGTSLGVLLLAVFAAYGTAVGRGPFYQPELHAGILFLWAYLIAATTFNLMVTGIEIGRSLVEERLVASANELKELNTALSQAAEQAEELNARAEASNRAKSLFLANVSHEIRTPLNGILSLGSFLAEGPLTRDQQQHVANLRDCGESLLRFINDILDFSRMEAGKLKIENVAFNLGKVLEQSTQWLTVEAGRKGVELCCEVAPGIPALLRGDPGRLRQILVNLVHNAVKFTSQGRIIVRVEMDGQEGECVRLRFTVRDTGSGIASQWIDRLFAPYERFDAYPYSGSGLGLAISRELTELMGGAIGVKEEPGEGATFWFTVTLAVAEMKETSPASETPAPDASDGATAPVCLLLVEDNRVNQVIGRILLRKQGYEATVVSNGIEALEALRSESYALILMDCQMPEMDGFETSRFIRSGENVFCPRDIPIIAMTAGVHPDTQQRCLEAGMNDCLTKPIRETELAAALERWLPPSSV
ncbi:MAG TPA: MASE1 domain-containing protein [Chthoniobacteraceae bacterium]|nr:MASE1 domain-containing protein [Chthoniobacteraceae bacterium]